MTTNNPAEALREALARHDVQAEAAGSCLDGYCVVKRPQGQHTNGGCRCSTDRMKASRMMMAGQALANAVRAALASPAPAGGEADPTPLKLVYDKGRRTIVLEMKGARYTLTKITDAPAASPPPSPDVAGVVEMLREGAQSIDNDATSSQAGPGAEELRSVATLLESLSAEKGKTREAVIEECARVADVYAEEVGRSRYAAFEIAERIRARTALTPKEKA